MSLRYKCLNNVYSSEFIKMGVIDPDTGAADEDDRPRIRTRAEEFYGHPLKGG